jgi:transcriptional regulator with GAF, ATPase, and Fis domain
MQNVIERAVILSRGGALRLDLVSPDRTARARELSADAAPVSASEDIVPEPEWRRREKANILAALRRAGGRIYGHDGAAALLGVKPSTLSSRLRALRSRANGR